MPYRTQSPDTSIRAERVEIELLRKTSSWRKLELIDGMNQMLCQLALSGLRLRHPNLTDEELRRRLADLLLGPELARKVYGPC